MATNGLGAYRYHKKGEQFSVDEGRLFSIQSRHRPSLE
jgi:hypothetical protein